VNLTIDEKKVTAAPGETILACALRHDIPIPHLCTHPCLPPFGACRMCLVEVEGMRGYPPACTTPAAEGMVIHTNTSALQKLRRNILGLIMLEHPNACLICGKRELCEQYRPKAEKVGRTTGCHTCNNKEVCEVRVLAADLNLATLPVPPIYHMRPIERSDPFIDRDLNLCILCGRCVRICKHQHGTAVIDFLGRSSRTRIGEAFDRSLAEANCRFCGSCVDVCPTGSLSDRYAKWYGKPDTAVATTCQYCEAACAIEVASQKGKSVSAKAVNEAIPSCVLGRFAIPEFLNAPDRLRMPLVRFGEVLRESPWNEAMSKAAERLKSYSGTDFALICDATSTLEDRYVFRKFTKDVMKSENYIEIQPDVRGLSRASLPSGVKAVLLTGNFVDVSELKGLELLIVQDCYPTPASTQAAVVFPAAVFAETQGTVVDGAGQRRPLKKACDPPGQARPEWRIICDLAQAMGATGFGYASASDIAREAGIDDAGLWIDRAEMPRAAGDPKFRRTYFRGHRIDEWVGGLRSLSLDAGVVAPPGSRETKGVFDILEKREVAPNSHEIVIRAPEIARKARAGQFVIVMADETSERVPYTLCDWDSEHGTITLVVQEKGQSSRKLILMHAGDKLAHVVGPLGTPLEIKQYGTVALACGCYGIGAAVPIAKAMKAAGNHVIIVAEARSHYMAYYKEKLGALGDEFVQTTIDGSSRVKGHAVDVIERRLKDGAKLDCVIALGCPFMMMLTGNATKPFGVKTLAALNPIMVDGTGMCGACRITVDGQMKFACVDGPFFDAHLVDWDEVRDRREAYSAAEIQSVGRTEPVAPHTHAHGHACSCSM